MLDEFGPQPVLVAFAAVQTVSMALIALTCFVNRRGGATADGTLEVAA